MNAIKLVCLSCRASISPAQDLDEPVTVHLDNTLIYKGQLLALCLDCTSIIRVWIHSTQVKNELEALRKVATSAENLLSDFPEGDPRERLAEALARLTQALMQEAKP